MSSRVLLGLLFLLFGIGLFMHQADIIDFIQLLSMWWPLILVIIGIVQLINRTYSSVVSGLLFFTIGMLLLINQLFELNLTPYLFPLILIVVGFIILFTRVNREKTPHTKNDINTFALFSSAEINSHSKTFRGGTITTVFGGAEIDLREAHITEDAFLDITSVFGGVELSVPAHVQVKINGSPIFSGVEDRTRNNRENEEVLVLNINNLLIFSGLEIKN